MLPRRAHPTGTRSIHRLAFGLGAASLSMMGCGGGEAPPFTSGSTAVTGVGGGAGGSGSGATGSGSGGGAAGAGGAPTSTSSTGTAVTAGSTANTGSGTSTVAGGAGGCMTDADCGSQGCVPGTCVGGICYYVSCDADCDGLNGAMCGGSDCDDSDPAIPAASESCGNGKDDDCNGWTDTADPACGLQNDTCAGAADASTGGTFMATTQGAAGDYNVMGLPDLVYGVTTSIPLEAHVGLTIPALPPGWMWPNDGVNFGVWLGPGCDGAMYNGFYCAGGGGPLCGALPATQSFCQRLAPGTFSVVVGTETTQSMLGYPFTLNLGLVPPPAMPCGALTDVSAGGAFPLDPLDPKWTNALGECGT